MVQNIYIYAYLRLHSLFNSFQQFQRELGMLSRREERGKGGFQKLLKAEANRRVRMCNLQSAKDCASVKTSLATVRARAQEWRNTTRGGRLISATGARTDHAPKHSRLRVSLLRDNFCEAATDVEFVTDGRRQEDSQQRLPTSGHMEGGTWDSLGQTGIGSRQRRTGPDQNGRREPLSCARVRARSRDVNVKMEGH